MNAPASAFIVSFLAMVLIAASYFFKRKSSYLLSQAMGIVCLILSYFFTGEYFAMLGLSVALVRTVVFFLYEKEGKRAPVFLAFVFSALTVAVYEAVNLWTCRRVKPLDILCLVSLVLYSFIFRMRDLKKVRFAVLIPTSLAIIYNIGNHTVPFVIISYVFELGANVASILKYHAYKQKNKTQSV